MQLILFFASILCSLIIFMVIRQIDKRNRSFDKIAKLGKSVKDDIVLFSKERLQEIKDFDNCVDVTFQKGNSLLDSLNKTINQATQNAKLLDAEKLGKILSRMDSIENEMHSFKEKIDANSEANQFSKNTAKFIKDSLSEIKTIKNDIGHYVKEIENKKNTINSALRKTETDVSEMIDKNKEKIIADMTGLQSTVTSIEESVNHLKNDFFNNIKVELNNLDDTYNNRIHEMKSDLSGIESELRAKLEEKISDYGAYITRIENRSQNIGNEIQNDLNKTKESSILDMKVALNAVNEEIKHYSDKMKSEIKTHLLKTLSDNEEKNRSLLESFKTIEIEMESKVRGYEKLIHDNTDYLDKIKRDTFKEIDQKLNDFNLHLNTANDMGIRLELEIFNDIKGKLNELKQYSENEIETISRQIQEKNSEMNTLVNEKYSYTKDKIAEMNQWIDNTRTDFGFKVGNFQEELVQIKERIENTKEFSDKKFAAFHDTINQTLLEQNTFYKNNTEIVKNELIKEMEKYKNGITGHIIKIKSYFDKEVENVFSRIDKSMNEISSEADEKTVDVKNRFEEKYLEVEKKLLSVRDQIVARSEDLDKEIVSQSEKLTESIDSEMAAIKDSFIEKQNLFESQINILLSDKELHFNKKIESMNKLYETFSNELNTQIQSIELKYNQLDEYYKKDITGYKAQFQELGSSIDQIKNTLDQNITEKIENGTRNIETTYKTLEDETIRRVEQYREDLIKIKQTLKSIDSQFIQRFNEKMAHFDNKFDTRIQMYNEKFKINVEELIEINNKKLNGFAERFAEVNQSIQELKNRLTTEIEGHIAAGKSTLTTQYKSLEDETIKKINDYKNELLRIRENMQQLDTKFISKFSDKANDIDKQLENKIEDFNAKYQSHIKMLEKEIAGINEIYSNKAENMIRTTESRLDEYVAKYDGINQAIQELKEKLDKEISMKMEEGKADIDEMFQNKLSGITEQYQLKENEIIDKMESYKKDFFKLQQNMKQVDDRFTARFLEHAGILDKKIIGIEDEIKKFERSTGLFDKLNNYREKLNEDIKFIKEQIDQVKRDRENIAGMESKMMAIHELIVTTEEKYNSVVNNDKKIESVISVFNELKNISSTFEQKLQNANNAKLMLTNFETKIDTISSKIKSLENYYQDVADKEEKVKESFKMIETISGKSEDLHTKFDTVNKKLDDIEFKRSTYEKSLKNFEKDALLITKSQVKVTEVIEKFNQMDNLIEDLELRTESINKIREWLVKAETQMENLNQETDKRIKLLEGLMKKSPDLKQQKGKSGDEASQKEVILQLQSQGWTIDDIAKTLNLSTGEVEFILDLEYHKTGKR